MSNTFSLSRFLPITVYVDGSFREDAGYEVENHEEFMKTIEKQMEKLRDSLNDAVNKNNVKGLVEHLDSLTELKDLMEEIWKEEYE